MAKLTIECDVGEVSDGYHTFNELYAHRCTLFSALTSSYKHLSWKSRFHYDNSSFEGWFIAGMDLPTGTVTYHLPINPFWDIMKVNELDKAPEWDGHTSNDVIKRIVEWMDQWEN